MSLFVLYDAAAEDDSDGGEHEHEARGELADVLSLYKILIPGQILFWACSTLTNVARSVTKNIFLAQNASPHLHEPITSVLSTPANTPQHSSGDAFVCNCFLQLSRGHLAEDL